MIKLKVPQVAGIGLPIAGLAADLAGVDVPSASDALGAAGVDASAIPGAEAAQNVAGVAGTVVAVGATAAAVNAVANPPKTPDVAAIQKLAARYQAGEITAEEYQVEMQKLVG
jgi:hypothetical protein